MNIKNFPDLLSQLLPKHVQASDLEIWSQDEIRIGQQGSSCRIWAKRGSRPRKVKQRQFLSTYIYGAANHHTGQSCALVLPYANTIAMSEFLFELSGNIQQGKHAAVIIDNASWHKSNELVIPDNITLIPLPPYSPELNAIEQVWEWLRNHHFAHQCYDNYQHIVNRACKAWNEFSKNTALVKSIMQRDWINLP
jgi:transposase